MPSSSHLLSICWATLLLLRLHPIRKAQRTSSKITRHTSTAILCIAAAASSTSSCCCIAACTCRPTLLLLLVLLVSSCRVHEQRLDKHLVLLHCSPRCCCLGWQVSQQCAVAR
jgi:hypothetical protein